MSRIAYVNGRYLPHRDAAVHIEDRGYQFADGVYEVCEVRAGRLVDERRHMERLRRSLQELRIVEPMTPAALSVVLHEIVARNKVTHGIVYMQVTRGVARRDHAFPALGNTAEPRRHRAHRSIRHAANVRRQRASRSSPFLKRGGPGSTSKSVALLPNVLAKQAAREADAREAWFVDRDGFITEGASANAWIVTGDGRVMTRPSRQCDSSRDHADRVARRYSRTQSCDRRTGHLPSPRLMPRARHLSPRRARSCFR